MLTWLTRGTGLGLCKLIPASVGLFAVRRLKQLEETLSTKKLAVLAAGLVASALALSACTPPPAPAPAPPTESTTAGPSESATPSGPKAVSVMWNQPMFSLNTNTSFGNATANANIDYLTQGRILYYGEGLERLTDTSYGSYELLSEEPLTVKQTIAPTAKWSDGVPVTVADMILTYGAVSGIYDTLTPKDAAGLVDANGLPTPSKEGDVWFDVGTGDPGLKMIDGFPTIENDTTISYTYTQAFADWETRINSFSGSLPAHIVGKRALGIADPTEAKAAVLDAFQKNDKVALSKISNVWRIDWNLTEMTTDEDILVHSGPYKLTEYVKGQYLTLTKDPAYAGAHVPTIETITIRYTEKPEAAVEALKNDEVQLISPQATADILQSLTGVAGIGVHSDIEGTFEHVDLTFDNGGPFDPAAYGGDAEKANKIRKAFLLTIPRQDIVDKIIKPLNPNAEVRNSFTVIPGSPAYGPVTTANKMGEVFASVDIEGAKALLAEAGVASPKVRMLFAQANQRRQQQFALIKASAEQAGFEIIDGSLEKWGEALGGGTYDAALFAWQSTGTGVTESDANYRTGGLNNFGGYENAEVDKLLDQLAVSPDADEQARILGEVEAHLVADNFGTTIYQFPSVTGYSEKLTGIKPISISPTIFWNFWEWDIAA